jgi:hypothetical protein
MSLCCLEYLSIFLSLSYERRLLFCFFSSDNENRKKDVATAPIVDAPAIDEPPSQEAAVVPKSPEAAAKKAGSRASKHLKKASVASTSLDAPRPITSTDDVSATFLFVAFYF